MDSGPPNATNQHATVFLADRQHTALNLFAEDLDDNLNNLDVDVATVARLHQDTGAAVLKRGHTAEPIEEINTHNWFVACCLQYFQTVRFASKEMESRYQEWSVLQNLTSVRLAVITVNLLYAGLIVDLLLKRGDSVTTEHYGQFAIITAFQIAAAAFVWYPSCFRCFSLATRANISAFLTTCASGVVGVLATYKLIRPEFHEIPGYVSFGVQVALMIYLCDGLFVQVIPFLLCTVLSHGLWLAFLLRAADDLPPALLLICVPLIALLKARYLYRTHVSRRFEFQLQVRLVRHINQLQESEAALTEQRVRAARELTARETHQAIMGYACHELRNPLHGLRGCLEDLKEKCVTGHGIDEYVLRDQPDSSHARSCPHSGDLWNLDSIGAAVEQMTRVTDDVLDFNKLQAGKLQVANRPCALRTIVDRVVIQYRAAETPVSCTVAPQVPQVIHSDPLRVAQVLTNGVTNALKHANPATAVLIQITTRDDVVVVEVLNEGRGLRGINVRNLFQLYERGDDETSDNIKGVGLGLPICKYVSPSCLPAPSAARSHQSMTYLRMLMTLLGGQIGLEDRGPHTVFWFTLPLGSSSSSVVFSPPPGVLLATPLASQVPDAASPAGPELIMSDATCNLHNYWGRRIASRVVNVLVVDDELVNRRILVRMLAKLGYHTSELQDGDEVFSFLDFNGLKAIDMCLLDVHMARTDGRDVVREMRAKGIDVPVIACTGNCSTADASSYRQAGFDGILSKPFTWQDLAQLISQTEAVTGIQ